MAGMIPERDIEEIRERANIVDVISQYVALKPAGAHRMKGLCPFHSEKTASFLIDTEKQLYYCFGCGAGGDIFSFIMQTEKLDFVEAVESVAQRIRYQISYSTTSKGKKEGRERLYKIMEEAKNAYRAFLKKSALGSIAVKYLNDRGFSNATIDTFEIGVSPDRWDFITKHLLKKGFKEEELYKVGISHRGDKGPYDVFRGRIMFPIKDIKGRVVAFGGRILLKGEPKYLNSAETALFKKGSLLYNLEKARSYIVAQDKTLVVEGYTDVMALHQAGFPYVVATLGTALTSEHLKMLSRFSKNILLAFDADSAGKTAAERGLELIGSAGDSKVSIILFPEGIDPAEFCLRRQASEVSRLLESGIRLEDYCINERLKRYDLKDPKEKSAAIGSLKDVFNVIQDPIVQEEYLRILSTTTGVSIEALRVKLLKNRVYNKKSNLYHNLADVPKETDARKEREEELLRILLQKYPESFGLAKKKLEAEEFSDNICKNIYKTLLEFSESNDKYCISDCLQFLRKESGEEAFQKASQLVMESFKCVETTDWRQLLMELIVFVKKSYLDGLVFELRKRHRECEKSGNHDKCLQILSEVQSLALLKKNLSRSILENF